MNRKIIKYFTFLLLFLIANGNLLAQEEGELSGNKVGTTSFQFLKVMPDARSTALGEVSSSILTTSEAVFHNPAA